MSSPIPAPMTKDTRFAPAPAPPMNMKYAAISNTLRHLQDSCAEIEILTDDGGKAWAVPGVVLQCLMDRFEVAAAKRAAAGAG